MWAKNCSQDGSFDIDAIVALLSKATQDLKAAIKVSALLR
jgi:hypothetical protein